MSGMVKRSTRKSYSVRSGGTYELVPAMLSWLAVEPLVEALRRSVDAL